MSITIKTAGLEDYLEGGSGRLKFLLTGPAGSGKTRFAAFAPKPIYADTEDGLLSVADRAVPYASIKSEEDMNAFLTLLENECKKPAAQRRWETCIIDTFDTFERHVITNYLRRMKRKEMDGWEDWGYLSGVMTSVVARLFLLPMNVIVLCHTKDVRRKGQVPEDQVVLRLKGDLSQQLPNDFDFVGMIEIEFAAVEGSRDIVRTIRWETTPAASWLKFRGGGVQTTPLTFSEDDYAAIRTAITSRASDVAESTVVEVVQAPTDVAPAVAPTPGVAVPVARKATPAKAPEAAPVESAVPPTPPVVAPVPAAPKPDLSPPVETVEEAVDNVKEVLNGQVISDTAGELEEPPPAPQTDVAEPELAADPEPVQADTTQQKVAIPDDGQIAVRCGDARFTGGTPKGTVPGCGKELEIELEAARIVKARAENAQLMEMAGLRERAFLCNACFKASREAAMAL